MKELSFPKAIYRDPLSDETKKERRNLLATSALGIIMVWTGLIPAKIEALGVEFSPVEQNILLRVLGAIVVYFLFAFVVYAFSDFWSYRIDSFTELKNYYLASFDNLQKILVDMQKVNEELSGFSSEWDALIQEGKLLQDEHMALNKALDQISTEISEKKTAGKTRSALEIKRLERRLEEMGARNEEIKREFEINRSNSKGLRERQEALKQGHDETDKINMLEEVTHTLVEKSRSMARIRLFFDFVIPPVIAGYSLFLLFRH